MPDPQIDIRTCQNWKQELRCDRDHHMACGWGLYPRRLISADFAKWQNLMISQTVYRWKFFTSTEHGVELCSWLCFSQRYRFTKPLGSFSYPNWKYETIWNMEKLTNSLHAKKSPCRDTKNVVPAHWKKESIFYRQATKPSSNLFTTETGMWTSWLNEPVPAILEKLENWDPIALDCFNCVGQIQARRPSSC